MSATLFQRLLGAEFYHLSEEVRHLHGLVAPPVWHGRCTIERGESSLARMACAISRMPPSMSDAPLQVSFQRDPEKEIWQRSFGGKPLRSTLKVRARQLHERIGPMRLQFRLYRIDDVLHWVGEGARLFGFLPLPGSWFEETRCREYSQDGRYHFEVEVNLPLIGPMIRYQGWLEPA